MHLLEQTNQFDEIKFFASFEPYQLVGYVMADRFVGSGNFEIKMSAFLFYTSEPHYNCEPMPH